MKIDITYEKADILRLVTDDLVRKGIQPKSGAPIEYKGALSIKLSVDADPVEPAAASALPTESVTPATPAPPAPEPSMDEVLSASRQAERTPPTFKNPNPPTRMLGKNESYEFPEE
jgi:hypothetical protein